MPEALIGVASNWTPLLPCTASMSHAPEGSTASADAGSLEIALPLLPTVSAPLEPMEERKRPATELTYRNLPPGAMAMAIGEAASADVPTWFNLPALML